MVQGLGKTESGIDGDGGQIVWSRNEQPRSKLRGIEHPSLNSFRGKPRGIEPGGIKGMLLIYVTKLAGMFFS